MNESKSLELEELKLLKGNEALLFELKIFNVYIDAKRMFSRKLLARKKVLERKYNETKAKLKLSVLKKKIS